MGKNMGLSPAIILLSLSTFGVMFGFLGPFTAGRVKGYVLYLNEKVTLEVDSLGQVKTGALQDSIVSIYGKRPELRTLSGRLYALVALGEQTLRSDSVALTLAVKPKAPFIDKAYYLIGNMNDWKADDVSKLIKLNIHRYARLLFSAD